VSDASGRRGIAFRIFLNGNVIESLADGIIVAGLDGRFLLSTPQPRRFLGWAGRTHPRPTRASVYGFFLSDTVTLCPAEQLPLPAPCVAKSS